MNRKDCGAIIVTELKTDKCKGCFIDLECIVIPDNINFLNIVEGDTLKQYLNALLTKIQEQEQRILILENGIA